MRHATANRSNCFGGPTQPPPDGRGMVPAGSRFMLFDADRLQRNVETATTEDLLDRATVHAAGMEREALDLIEAELRRRGVTAEQQRARGERGKDRWFIRPDGTVITWSF